MTESRLLVHQSQEMTWQQAVAARCETTFETYMADPHGHKRGTHQDKAGHWWCGSCQLQLAFMNTAMEKGWPPLSIRAPRAGAHQLQGEKGYLLFAKTWGATYLQSVLLMLQAQP